MAHLVTSVRPIDVNRLYAMGYVPEHGEYPRRRIMCGFCDALVAEGYNVRALDCPSCGAPAERVIEVAFRRGHGIGCLLAILHRASPSPPMFHPLVWGTLPWRG